MEYEQEQSNIERHAADHPDQMQQAEIDVLRSKAIGDPLQAADRQARMEAVEAYLGGDVLEHCGANGPGGKGFQPGNTCAKGVSGLKKTLVGTGKVIPDGTRLKLADGSTAVIVKSGGKIETKGGGVADYRYDVIYDSNGMTDYVSASQIESGAVEIADDQTTPMNDSKTRLKSTRGEFEKFTPKQGKAAPVATSTIADIESLPDDAVITVKGVSYKRPWAGADHWAGGTVKKKVWTKDIGGATLRPAGVAWVVDEAGEEGKKALEKALKALKAAKKK